MSRRETEIAERIDELETEAMHIRIEIDSIELDLYEIYKEIERLEEELENY